MAHWQKFIDGGSLAADFTSDSIPCNRGYELQIQLKADGSGTAVNGSFYVQESNNGGTDWYNIPLDKVMGAVGATAKTFTHTDGDEAIVVASSSASIHIAVKIASPGALVRVFFDRTNGAASSLNGWYMERVDR